MKINTRSQPRFELTLKILDLNNVPYVSGRSYVKWSLPHTSGGGAEEHRGRTDKIPIKDHKVLYNYNITIPVRMVIDKQGMLQELPIELHVLHEVSSGGKGERILLGNVKLNLAEYVEASEEGGEEGVMRRYLMQDSKINSTLKVGIFMKQTEGDRNFTAPDLKVAPVFSGIAGIVVGEPEDKEGLGPRTPAAVISKAQVAENDLRELYRQTIAVEWTSLPGSLSADKVIEDIFSGGDGWGPQDRPRSSGKDAGMDPDETIRGHHHHHSRNKSSKKWNAGFYKPRHDNTRRSREELSVHKPSGIEGHEGLHRAMGVRGRASFERRGSALVPGEEGRSREDLAKEYRETEVRSDLRSWRLPA